MIQPNELRLGNYVQDRGGKVLKIDTFETTHNGEEYVLKVGQRMFVNGNEVHPLTEYSDYLQPIPLSDEWLAKFGFDDDGFRQYTLLNWGIKVVESLASKGSWIVYQGFLRQFQEIAEVQYIHQLQNLFFALTGEELKLNEL